MRRLGATAVPLPLNEVMPSLQRGVIDGTMSGTAIFVAFKMNDVAKTMTVTNDTMLVSLAVVSKVFLDKLPPDLRKTVLDVGRETQKRTSAWEQEFSKGLDKAWVDQGGIMHTLPPDDLKKMAELLNSVGDDVSKDQPAVNEMLKRVRAVAAKTLSRAASIASEDGRRAVLRHFRTSARHDLRQRGQARSPRYPAPGDRADPAALHRHQRGQHHRPLCVPRAAALGRGSAELPDHLGCLPRRVGSDL